MENTDKAYCREIADLLAGHGVRHCVVCPGSRNAPLIVAMHRHPKLKCISIIDERSAAFAALGLATISGRPVALVCTSGSAVLNFSPAVAEAYYRQAPLIVISADRPEEWIDQDDSQTIRQNGILGNIVKKSVDTHVELSGDSWRARAQAWHVNRIVNDCLIEAVAAPAGPVHINVQLDAPLGKMNEACPESDFARVICVERPSGMLPTARVRELAEKLAWPQKALVIAGFMPPDEKVSRALTTLASMPNVAVMTEAQANVHGGADFIGNIDLTLAGMTKGQREELRPDVVITIGGSLVSRIVKGWLRESEAKHWHIGMQPYSVDCFIHLDLRIAMQAKDLMPALASAMRRQIRGREAADGYAAAWRRAKREAQEAAAKKIEGAPWSDLIAMRFIMNRMPSRWNLQLSNGTAVRYAQMFDYRRIHRIDCNRGVSGIDGCASTAIGAAHAYSGTTLLVTGDMSMQYDISALSSPLATPRVKIAVLNNGGGGIFRCVASTRDLPELDQYFACRTNLPLRELAQAYGFAYFEARGERELEEAWTGFEGENQRPAILNLITDAAESASILRQIIPL
ncbi:MAG: 2-succinyl-5-enolpyruvyl-6-hydroxy-3-cyclohexene-1-carboxylic-acid synthase [Clostridium sp.]|nr:2-succinyl-5-enolpyruvyl-6-hydroxy-3-cyclohexene-1-carboxylic-acid synthase [Clostridium sp.]